MNMKLYICTQIFYYLDAEVLEEAALMSRVLAFLSPCSPTARALTEDAAAQARRFGS